MLESAAKGKCGSQTHVFNGLFFQTTVADEKKNVSMIFYATYLAQNNLL